MSGFKPSVGDKFIVAAIGEPGVNVDPLLAEGIRLAEDKYNVTLTVDPGYTDEATEISGCVRREWTATVSEPPA
jgi:hypothetical protein